MEDIRAKELVQQGSSLFSKKMQWDQLCQEIAENFYPMRADFTSPFTLGQDFSEDLMDSYPVQARETLGNAPQAMLRQGEWFTVKTGIDEIDEDKTNAAWMETTTNRFRTLIYDRRAQFVRATTEADHDYVAFGTAVLSVEEGPARNHFLFRDWHPGSCAWMENGSGAVDTLHRKMKMSARNMKRRWPKTLHSEIVRACETDPSQEFDVRHIVLPTEDLYGDDRKKRRQYAKMPFLSLYVDTAHESILGEGPLPVFNYVVPRLRRVTGLGPLGFSPMAVNALPDGRMLQALSRIILEQGEKAIDPPMVAKGEMFRDAVNLYAGGLTYVDLEDDQKLQDIMQVLETGSGLSFGMEMKADVRQLIAEAFLLNKLFLPNVREMTAYETQQRMDEYRRAALPFFGPIESEYHLPMLDAAFQIAVHNRQFNFDEMPEALQGEDVTFAFDSPLNTAEGRKNVAAFQESVQIIAASAEFDNTIPAKYNFQKMTEDAVRGTGAPSDWEQDEKVVQSADEAAAATARVQKTAAALREGAGVAGDVANASIALQQAGLAA